MTELSSTTIRVAKPGEILRDAQVPGLHLRATPKGKAFYLYFRTKVGKERRPKLGDAAVMTLAQARQLAKDLLVRVAAGEDPIAARQEERDSPTVAQLVERYLVERVKGKKSEVETTRLFRKHVLPALGDMKASAVTYDHIYQLHQSLSAAPYIANRVLAALSTAMSRAEAWGWRARGANPCRHVTRFPEVRRRRYMTAEETQRIVAELERLGAKSPNVAAFLWLLILTGARKNEIAKARWEWLDGNVLRLPDSKTGARDIHLPPAAMDVLAKLPRTSGTILSIAHPDYAWRIVRAAAGCHDLRLHDLRHSFASVAISEGLTLDQIGELLGHRSVQTTKGYAHLMEEHKARAAAVVGSAITKRASASMEKGV